MEQLTNSHILEHNCGMDSIKKDAYHNIVAATRENQLQNSIKTSPIKTTRGGGSQEIETTNPVKPTASTGSVKPIRFITADGIAVTAPAVITQSGPRMITTVPVIQAQTDLGTVLVATPNTASNTASSTTSSGAPSGGPSVGGGGGGSSSSSESQSQETDQSQDGSEKKIGAPTIDAQKEIIATDEKTFYKSWWFWGILIGGAGMYFTTKNKAKVLQNTLMGAAGLGLAAYATEHYLIKDNQK